MKKLKKKDIKKLLPSENIEIVQRPRSALVLSRRKAKSSAIYLYKCRLMSKGQLERILGRLHYNKEVIIR